MHKLIGIACVVAGVLLMVSGYNVAHELGAKVRHVFTGAVPDRARLMLIGGGAVFLAGVLQIYLAKK
jgi:hypothetical protein